MFNNLFARDQGRVLTPVYVPNETYTFFINELLTDPDFNNLELRLIDSAGNVYTNIGTLYKLDCQDDPMPGGALMPYYIYSIFTFPIVPQREYQFIIYDTVYDEEKVRSNVILCEQSEFETTTRFSFRNTFDRSGFPYERLLAQDDAFYNIFRLPVSITQLTFESDKQQYRNASDNRFRNIRSYLDYNYKFDFLGVDENVAKGLAEMLECDQILIDEEPIITKTQLVQEQIPNSILSNYSFECYIDEEPLEDEDLRAFGDIIFYAGTPGFDPETIIDQNE